MRIGQLRHHIIIDSKVTSQDSYGQVTYSWSSNVAAWASIQPIRGAQFIASQQVQAGVTHEIKMRYKTLAASTAIAPGYCRVRFGTRVFTIEAVINPDERNVYLDLMCMEEV